MAGDWMKLELSTPEKPEVMLISDRLKIPRPQVLGSLFLVWRWFNQQTVDGNARVTLAALSEIAGTPGFAEAMQEVAWLSTGSDPDKYTVSIPAFDLHNGESAKKRALTAKRSQRFRNALATQPQRKQRDQEKYRVYKPRKGNSTSKTPHDSDIPPGSIRCKTCKDIWAGANANGQCNPCWRKAQGME